MSSKICVCVLHVVSDGRIQLLLLNGCAGFPTKEDDTLTLPTKEYYFARAPPSRHLGTSRRGTLYAVCLPRFNMRHQIRLELGRLRFRKPSGSRVARDERTFLISPALAVLPRSDREVIIAYQYIFFPISAIRRFRMNSCFLAICTRRYHQYRHMAPFMRQGQARSCLSSRISINTFCVVVCVQGGIFRFFSCLFVCVCVIVACL